jgi:prepilin-type N-terminal cleavage/methylation domain-containing protein
MIYANKSGFTLAELAVVITIVGLLVAVVAAGVNLRASSELQGMIYGISQHQASMESFEVKYDDLPGDMVDAHSYWDNGLDTICGTAVQCNGNGNGHIELSGSALSNESFRMWQHLLLARLIEGSFTGEGRGTGNQADPGINVPSSPRSKVGYVVLYGQLNGSERNEIRIGAYETDAAATAAALSAREGLAFDNKTDDGNPLAGQTRAADGSDVTATSCVSGGEYVLGDELVCVVAMPILYR